MGMKKQYSYVKYNLVCPQAPLDLAEFVSTFTVVEKCHNCFRSAIARIFSLATVPRRVDLELTDSNYTLPLLALLTLEEIRTR